MMAAAAGMAVSGKVPYVSTMAAFASMRACEQVRTDIAYPNLNVRIIATHSGLSMGNGGSTHHSTEDLAIMRSIPNLTVIGCSFCVMNALFAAEHLEEDDDIHIRVLDMHTIKPIDKEAILKAADRKSVV